MRKNYCVVNGKLREASKASIGATDSSFALGDGLFETIKIVGGGAVWLDEHLARMEESARFAQINFFQKNSCADWCKKLIAKNGVDEGFLRITLSRGATSAVDMPEESLLAITAADFSPDKKPFRAAFARWPVNELDPATRHKTTSRFSFALAGRELKRSQLDELLFLNTKGEVAEGTRTNIFWIKNGELFTPAIECGILPGIARAKVIERAKTIGMNVTEGRFFKKSLMEADEIFFTNSLILLRPCASHLPWRANAARPALEAGEQLSHAISEVCLELHKGQFYTRLKLQTGSKQ